MIGGDKYYYTMEAILMTKPTNKQAISLIGSGTHK